MRRIVVFCLGLMCFVSCKTKGDKNNSNQTDFPVEERVIVGKVVDATQKKIAFAAIKLYLDDDDCMHAFSDDDGFFEFKVDELRIKDQSHFEVVYKGHAINFLSLRNHEEKKPIVLSKKGEVVTAADYNIFSESIKSCSTR